MILLISLTVATATDVSSMEIPVWLFPTTLFLYVVWWVMAGVPITKEHFYGAIVIFIPMLVLCLTGMMGGGDLIMFTAIGFILGLFLLPVYMFWVGCAASVQLILIKMFCIVKHKNKSMRAETPIAPIAFAAYIILLIRGHIKCIL